MKIFGLLRGGLLVAMFINAAGGILTSNHYAFVFRVSVAVAVAVVVTAIVFVVGRAAVTGVRPGGFGIVLWAGLAAGAVTTGALTRPGMTWTLVAVWAVVTVATFIAERSSAAPASTVR